MSHVVVTCVQVEGGKDRELLGNIAQALKSSFSSGGIVAVGDEDERSEGFVPHVTIMKTGKDRDALAEANRCGHMPWIKSDCCSPWA